MQGRGSTQGGSPTWAPDLRCRVQRSVLSSLFLFLNACATGMLPAQAGAQTPSPHSEQPAIRQFEFSYRAVVKDLPADTRQVDLWIPVPPDTPQQLVLDWHVDAQGTGETNNEPVYGNRVWHLRANPPAGGEITALLTARVIIKERLLDWQPRQMEQLPITAFAQYLQPHRLVPATERFSDIARRQTAGYTDVVAQARALYDYVLDKMRYDKSGTGWGRGDANYACDIGRGNCTDFHSLFMALARSVGIPTRFWMGFPLPAERGADEVAGYHCWAEFWAPGLGWVPVDISEADKNPERADYFFGNLDENRIVFTLGRDLDLAPRQQADALNYFIYPYAEADGKAWDQVERRFSFRDLPTGSDRGR